MCRNRPRSTNCVPSPNGKRTRLEKTIQGARLQGIDTIYSERRLVVADLGLQASLCCHGSTTIAARPECSAT